MFGNCASVQSCILPTWLDMFTSIWRAGDWTVIWWTSWGWCLVRQKCIWVLINNSNLVYRIVNMNVMHGVDNFKIDPYYKSIYQTTHYWFHIYDLEISFIFRFHSPNFVRIFQLSHTCYMANLYHPHKQKNLCKNNFSRQLFKGQI